MYFNKYKVYKQLGKLVKLTKIHKLGDTSIHLNFLYIFFTEYLLKLFTVSCLSFWKSFIVKTILLPDEKQQPHCLIILDLHAG